MNKDGFTTVAGFKFAAHAAAIKKPGRLDLALIYSEVPARCAAAYTRNRVVAAPVTLTREHLSAGECQAILVNSGNANACTGEQGLADARESARLLANALGIPERLVAVSSTGVIGVPLPMEKLRKHIPALPKEMTAQLARNVAEAIMTTDSFAKLASCAGEVAGRPYRILGIAKGAGMIHPDMATMLAFVLSDARVAPALLQSALSRAVERSFNCVTVDGDTSTNDMVLLLANGFADNPEIQPGTPAAAAFEAELHTVLLELARMMVRDGEGATKCVQIRVTGAVDDAQARLAARAVATSSLVKTAFFGEDANWGRILAAVGYSGAEIDPGRVEIRFGEIPVVRHGLSTGKELEAQATEVLKHPEFTVTIDLALGSGSADYYTSDLTYDYVRINADYRT